MLKRLSASIREYKAPTIVTVVLIVFEVIFECIIPFMTASLVNRVKAGTTTKDILITGAILVLMAVLSLVCGGVAAVTSSKASTGFAKNLRHDMFSKIQTYSFENIDKFSSSSLVTRLTTDVSNVQMAYMMISRIAIRCPLMLTFAIFMAWKMGGSLAATFVFAVPVMAFGLILIAKTAMPAFKRVFKKYDKLNESIEENVRAMRVVKGFAREEYEKEKFGNAAEEICKDFTKADRIVAFNTPLMQLCLYFNMIFILIVGSKLTISSMGTELNIGQISAMLTYAMQTLMSLMMLSVVYVMVTISLEPAKRICEVLGEEPVIFNPENPH